VKLPPALPEQPAVGDVVGEGVPEGVLQIREESGLVEELRPLQVVEPATERLLRQVGDRLEQGERHVLAHDGCDLEQALVLRGEPVDARCQNRLGGRRDLERLGRLGQLVGTAVARQGFRLDQRPDALLEEEGIALGPLDEEPLEWLKPRVGPE
jgi:hypothetical protein